MTDSGFDIVDLGCCKCISCRHPLWGAFTFVGTIFTSAPSSSPAIQTIMEILEIVIINNYTSVVNEVTPDNQDNSMIPTSSENLVLPLYPCM